MQIFLSRISNFSTEEIRLAFVKVMERESGNIDWIALFMSAEPRKKITKNNIQNIYLHKGTLSSKKITPELILKVNGHCLLQNLEISNEKILSLLELTNHDIIEVF